MKILFIFVLWLVLIFSCSNIDTNNSFDDSLLPKYNILITDTLKVNQIGNILVTDYLKDSSYFLIADYYSKKIFITDHQGNEKYSINKFGVGPEEYGDFRGVGFYEQNKIIVLEAFSCKLYSFDGSFIKSYSFPDQIIANPSFHFDVMIDKDELMLTGGNRSFVASIYHEDFYKMKNWIARYNFNNLEYNLGVPFEKASPYLNGYFLGQVIPMFDMGTEELFALFPLDPKVYVYNKNDLSLKSFFSTNPSYFSKPRKTKFPGSMENVNYNKVFRTQQLNSEYVSIRKLEDDFILTYYWTGLKEEEVVDTRKEYSEKGLNEKRKKYIQIFNEGIKITQDIEVSSQLTFLNAFNKNLLVFSGNLEDNESTLFYIGEIVE